jgi:hypothetical protein
VSSRPEGYYVDMVFQGVPLYPYVVGAHGLMQAGAASQGTWTDNGYSRSTAGSAVAFVYVDEAGIRCRRGAGHRR